MATYILNITYTLKEGRLDEFRPLAAELKKHFAGEMGKNYRILQVKGRPQDIVEQFICGSEEEFDALEDDMTERGEELVNRLPELVEGGKMSYSTLIEL